MKRISIIIGVVLAVCMSFLISQVEIQAASGTDKVIPLNTAITDNLSDKEEVDYFRFTLAKPGSVTVNLNRIVSNNFSEYSFSLYGYDSSSVPFLFDEGYTYEIDTNLNKRRLPAGEYFVKVRVLYRDWYSGDYQMTVKYVAEPGANFEKEFNDSVKQAYGITTNKVYTGNLSDSDDLDYYKFTLAQPGSVTVNLNKIVSNDFNTYIFSLYGYDSSSDPVLLDTIIQNFNDMSQGYRYQFYGS